MPCSQFRCCRHTPSFLKCDVLTGFCPYTARTETADSAGPAVHRLYEHSGKALAGLVPLAIVSPQDSTVAMVTDLALVPVITLHSHVSMNCIISDYVPRSVRALSRWGMLGVSAGAAIGLTRLAISGPGIAGSVKRLWD